MQPATQAPAETPLSKVLGETRESGPDGSSAPGDGSVLSAERVAATDQDEGGALPFTGLGLALLVVAGLALLLAGLTLQRIHRLEA